MIGSIHEIQMLEIYLLLINANGGPGFVQWPDRNLNGLCKAVNSLPRDLIMNYMKRSTHTPSLHACYYCNMLVGAEWLIM